MKQSTIALIFSGCSLCLSFWVIYRDRSKLSIISQFYEGSPEYGPNRFMVKAVNKGKRPIYIRAVGGKLKKNGWMSTHVGDTEFGKKLEEGQYIQQEFTIDDIYTEGPDFSDEYVEMWIEDSLGKRYKIPKSKKYIKRLTRNG